MDASPILPEAERLRIEEEERIRYETRRQIRRNGRRWIWKLLGGLMIAFVTAWVIGAIILDHQFPVGSEVMLSRSAVTFGSQDALDTFERLPANEAIEFARGANGLPDGARVRIVKSDAHRRCIVQVGLGGPRGEEGWIEAGWLSRFSTSVDSR